MSAFKALGGGEERLVCRLVRCALDVSPNARAEHFANVADFQKMRDRLHGRPLKQVVNDVSGRDMAPNPQQPEVPKFQVVPNHSGLGPGVDPLRLNQLNDELDVEDFTTKSE